MTVNKIPFAPASRRGFTLIELLVVIAIIGLLSSVVLASLNTARGKARDAKRISDIRQIQIAVELYATSNNNRYPNTSVVICGTDSSYYTTLSTALAPYMPRIPTDPAPLNCPQWGTNYVYLSNGVDYKIVSHSPENAASLPSGMWDPLRDGGSNGSIVDGTTPWAWALYTPGGAGW